MDKRIIRNSAWIVGCKLVKAILTLLITMLTARFFGVANFGLINYAASLVAFATPIMKLGIDGILVREVIVDPEKEGETMGSAIVLNLASSFLCIIGITLFASIANYGESETILICFLYSLLLIFQAVEMIRYWFQAYLLSKYTSIAILIAYLVSAVFQILLLVNKSSVYWFALSASVEYMVLAALLLVLYSRKGKSRLSFSFAKAKHLLSKGRYYIISGMMVMIFSQTDKIMLKIMVDNQAVGYYSAAMTCASMASFVFVAVIDSFRPVILKNKEDDQGRFEYSLSCLYSLIIYGSFIYCLLVSLLSPFIVSIMYGHEYSYSIGVLSLVVWFTTFSYIGTIRDIWILAEQKQDYLWKINLIGASANIILNLLLIPRFGVYGASVATLITQIFTNVGLCIVFKGLRMNFKLMLKGLDLRLLKDIIKDVLKSMF